MLESENFIKSIATIISVCIVFATTCSPETLAKTNYELNTEKYYSQRMEDPQVLQILENAKTFEGVGELTDRQTYEIVATKAYISPSKEAETTIEDQMRALNFRFYIHLTPNCQIEKFDLSPFIIDEDSFYLSERGIEALVLIPAEEFATVFLSYGSSERMYDSIEYMGDKAQEWKLFVKDIDYYYNELGDIAGRTRAEDIYIFKEKNGMIPVYFSAGSHTVINSVKELEEWY